MGTIQLHPNRRREWIEAALRDTGTFAESLQDVVVVEVYPDETVGVRHSNLSKHTIAGILLDAILTMFMAEDASDGETG